MSDWFFNGWTTLGRTALIGVLAYASLILLLRISGKRTLTKMNAFDLVVTVSLGSILAGTLTNQNVSLAQGAAALAVLILLQYVITWSSVRIPQIRHVLTGEPTMLAHKGECLPRALRKTRIAEEEVRAAVRSSGLSQLSDALAVILETDGSISVIPRSDRNAQDEAAAHEDDRSTRQGDK